MISLHHYYFQFLPWMIQIFCQYLWIYWNLLYHLPSSFPLLSMIFLLSILSSWLRWRLSHLPIHFLHLFHSNQIEYEMVNFLTWPAGFLCNKRISNIVWLNMVTCSAVSNAAQHPMYHVLCFPCISQSFHGYILLIPSYFVTSSTFPPTWSKWGKYSQCWSSKTLNSPSPLTSLTSFSNDFKISSLFSGSYFS